MVKQATQILLKLMLFSKKNGLTQWVKPLNFYLLTISVLKPI